MSLLRLGVISDTHGWLDPAVSERLAGVDAILHAGDIGAMAVLDALARIAPVSAVRGNNDRTPDLLALPEHLDLPLAGALIHLVHRPIDARPGDARVVITGHTHRAAAESRGGVLWLNPGAAGRQGFHRERTLAILELGDGPPRVAFIALGARGRTATAAAHG